MMLGLFAAFGLSLALATAKLPVFGISITAPLFGWIALEALTKRDLRPPALWMWLASLFWLALFASLAGNLIWGELGTLGREELVLLLRYAFWLLVFVATAALTARAAWTPRLVGWLAIAAAALAAMRLADELAGGRLWLHQNEYGLRFSVFVPFLLALALARMRADSVIALGVVAGACLLNGSRSSWVALAVAGTATLGLRALAGRSVRGPVVSAMLAAALLTGCAALAPPQWTRAVAERWASFESLETDKPFRMRLAMIEKGRRLFERQPIFGAGLGRFDHERVRLAAALAPWTNDESLNSRSSHSAYMSLLAETGVLGSGAFAILLCALLAGGARAACRLARRGEDWAIGVWASALALSIHLAALSGLTGALPWFVYGLTAGVIERERRRPIG